jgi:DNA processing protein
MKLQGLDAWLHCLLTDGLGLAARQDDLAEILGPALARALMDTDATQPGRQAVHDWLAAGPLRQVLRLDDSDYPSGLLNTPCPPPLLFLLGRRELLQRPMLAVVGSRHASVQGAQTAESWAEALAQAGLTIVSGMAAGIDAAAHTGALRTAASSVAVIGTGIDRIYPARNQALARQLAQTGLILSEFPLGAPPLAQHFPRRNRLIAGLSQGCLVVEASLKSGSLITGRLAAEYGRDVFAVPGSIHSPQAKGCHRSNPFRWENIFLCFPRNSPSLFMTKQELYPFPSLSSYSAAERNISALFLPAKSRYRDSCFSEKEGSFPLLSWKKYP